MSDMSEDDLFLTLEHIKAKNAALEVKLAECVDIISYLGANVLLLHAYNCPAVHSHANLFELCNFHVFKATKFLEKIKNDVSIC